LRDLDLAFCSELGLLQVDQFSSRSDHGDD
jgi:hypothetical protein